MPRDETRIRLVVFDWAGTAVDHGSRAPVMPFIRAHDFAGLVPGLLGCVGALRDRGGAVGATTDEFNARLGRGERP